VDYGNEKSKYSTSKRHKNACTHWHCDLDTVFDVKLYKAN